MQAQNCWPAPFPFVAVFRGLTTSRFESSGVMNLFLSQHADLLTRNFGEGDRLSVKGGEFDLVATTPFVNMHNRANVARRQPVSGEINRQRDAIQFFNHTDRG